MFMVPLQAMRKAGVQDPSKCYFIDDSRTNVEAAIRLGWSHCVHFCERGLIAMEGGKPKYIGTDIQEGDETSGITAVVNLDELRTVWAEIFRR